jgi:hypothetical protein
VTDSPELTAGDRGNAMSRQLTRRCAAVVLRCCRVIGLALVLCSVAASAASAKTLVFGSADNGNEGNNAAATLTDLGVTVDRQASLPADLTPYSSIWYVEAYQGLSSDDQQRLIDYISSGGSVYLTGERPCCETLNATDQNILRGVLKDQDVQVGGLGDIGGPFSFNGAAINDIASSPNLLVDFVPHSPGGMAGIGGVSSPNVFASNGQTPVGAAWAEPDMLSGKGRVAILMDIDYLDDPARTPIVENIANFLDRGTTCSNDGPDDGFLWTGPTATNSPANCSTLLTPDTISWTIGSDHAPVSISVQGNGVTTDCTTTGDNPVTDTCSLSDAQQNATLVVTASDQIGTVTRHYRVVPKNDPRNVPPGYNLDSNWWTWPDSDGDGIPDYWETNGVYVRGQYLDLPGMGADPNHKDLFVHYDFEEGHVLGTGVFDDMQAVFNSAPLSNPDGKDGVTLHVESGATIPSGVIGNFDLNQDALQRVTTYSGFADSPEAGGGGVPQIFKWMLNFDGSGAGNGTIGRGIIHGNYAWTAFPISSLNAALNLNSLPGDAEDFAQASNATHELGHLLGLHHHGAVDQPAHDPNYKSVMSYSYSNFGIPSFAGLKHRIDYSRTSNVHLDWQTGGGPGQITFVVGQHGEVPDFYASNNANVIDTSGEQPTEPTPAGVIQSADPSALAAFVDDFSLAATPDIPTLTGTQATVTSGQTVHIPLSGTDPDGAPLAYVIDTPPTLGTAQPAGDGLDYTANDNASGDDQLLVRAINLTFGSTQAVVIVHVVRPTPGVTSTSTSAAPQPAGAPSTTAAGPGGFTATVSRATWQKRLRSIQVTVACPSEACTARLQTTVNVRAGRGGRRTFRSRTVRRTLIGAQARQIAVPLPSAALQAIRRSLGRHAHVVVSVSVIVTDASGTTRNTFTRKVSITL